MAAIVLAIKPEYAEKIFNGEKTVEFRRKLPNEEIEVVYLYESSPVRKITGEFKTKAVMRDRDARELWRLLLRCYELPGITINDYLKYAYPLISLEPPDYEYKGSKKEQKMNCLLVDTATLNKYRQPLELSDLGVTKAPQNFCYIRNEI